MNDAVQFHSQCASQWEANYKSATFSVRERVIDELLAGRDLAGQDWLDAGCGTGTLSRFLAQHKGCRVTGVDASPEMIAHCKPAANTRFKQIEDVGKTGFPNASLDGVLCSSVLEYVLDPMTALRELHRVLKQYGLLLISVPSSHPFARWPVLSMYWVTKYVGSQRWFEYLDHSRHCFSELRFRRMLQDCGFSVEGMKSYGGPRGSPIFGCGTLMMFCAVKMGAPPS